MPRTGVGSLLKPPGWESEEDETALAHSMTESVALVKLELCNVIAATSSKMMSSIMEYSTSEAGLQLPLNMSWKCHKHR